MEGRTKTKQNATWFLARSHLRLLVTRGAWNNLCPALATGDEI